MKIVVDGNIGSGKSTQLNFLESKGYKVFREPIEKWPLELFYSNPERWGLTFQLIILETLTPEHGIHERCPLISKDVFWKSLSKTPEEQRVYQWAYDHHGWGPDLYIFLDKPPEICMKHIQNRNQAGDSGVTMELLQELDENYKELWSHITCPKWKLDATKSPDMIHENILNIVNDYMSEERL